MVDFAPLLYPHVINFKTNMNSTVLATLIAHPALSFAFAAAFLPGVEPVRRNKRSVCRADCQRSDLMKRIIDSTCVSVTTPAYIGMPFS